MRQDDLWKLEGGAWYARNRPSLTYDLTGYADPILLLLDIYSLKPERILDLGCADGWRASALAKRYGCEAIGLDISAEAIAAGRKLYPDLELHEGRATSLPLPDQSCSLVLVSFLLHCLDRSSLLLAASEIDRVLAWGGHLLLSDFDPDAPTRRPWKHRPGLWTYKLLRAGAGLFEATGLYRQLGCLSYDHDEHRLSADAPSERRGACVLLRKEDRYGG